MFYVRRLHVLLPVLLLALPLYAQQRDLTTLEGQPTQAVLLVGPDGVPVLALYPMQQQPDGSWKTAGCYLVPLKDEKL
jgi:hypothetical protein